MKDWEPMGVPRTREPCVSSLSSGLVGLRKERVFCRCVASGGGRCGRMEWPEKVVSSLVFRRLRRMPSGAPSSSKRWRNHSRCG